MNVEEKMRVFIWIMLVFWAFQPGLSAAQKEAILLAKAKEVAIKGQVEEINHPVLVLRGEDGQRYLVRLGPYWFWKERGYHLESGAKVEVVGFKRGKFIFPRLIRQDGQVLLFRDKKGFPLWRH